MIRRLQLAWAAGFIDGEGCIRCRPREGLYRVRLAVAQNESQPLLLLQYCFGGNVIKGKTTQVYIWEFNGVDVINALEELVPFLVTKKEEAQEVIKYKHCYENLTGPLSDIVKQQRSNLYYILQKLKDKKSLIRQAKKLKLVKV